jgi:peroxiredoxin family protein
MVDPTQDNFRAEVMYTSGDTAKLVGKLVLLVTAGLGVIGASAAGIEVAVGHTNTALEILENVGIRGAFSATAGAGVWGLGATMQAHGIDGSADNEQIDSNGQG